MNERKRIARAASTLLDANEPVVLINVLNIRGSTPREVGAKMLVSLSGTDGSIGGGTLEHEATCMAREMLVADTPEFSNTEKQFSLGTHFGQCCGGALTLGFQALRKTPSWLDAANSEVPVAILHPLGEHQSNNDAATSHVFPLDQLQQDAGQSLAMHVQRLQQQQLSADRISLKNESGGSADYLLELYDIPPTTIAIFGAGHVGTALTDILSKLNLRIILIDQRSEYLPTHYADSVTTVPNPEPPTFASHLPAGTLCFVMTHNHALDFDICLALLRRNDIPFCGLIGSDSKRRRFERLLRQADLETLGQRLTCPIGIDNIPGKTPYEIAISVSAQVLRQTQASNSNQLKETLSAAVSR